MSDENGRLDTEDLVDIGGGQYLTSDAATAYRKMVADAQKAGIKWGVTDSYRTYDQQVSVAKRKGLYSQGGFAAAPGTSNHGWGTALDLNYMVGKKAVGLSNTSPQFAWLSKNAGNYGFDTIHPSKGHKYEPWHWEYTAGKNKNTTDGFHQNEGVGGNSNSSATSTSRSDSFTSGMSGSSASVGKVSLF